MSDDQQPLAHHSANDGAAGGPSPAALSRADAEARVLRRLDRLSERRHRDAEPSQVDPEIVARLEACCAADDAPLEFRSLARRVHDGILTWEQYWEDPRTHAGDYRLMAAVLRDLTENPPVRPPVEPPSGR